MPCRCWQGFTVHQGKAQPNMAKLIGTTTLPDMTEGSFYTESMVDHGYVGDDADAAWELLHEEGIVADLFTDDTITVVFDPSKEAGVTALVAAL
jgi:hypothetical protein